MSVRMALTVMPPVPLESESVDSDKSTLLKLFSNAAYKLSRKYCLKISKRDKKVQDYGFLETTRYDQPYIMRQLANETPRMKNRPTKIAFPSMLSYLKEDKPTLLAKQLLKLEEKIQHQHYIADSLKHKQANIRNNGLVKIMLQEHENFLKQKQNAEDKKMLINLQKIDKLKDQYFCEALKRSKQRAKEVATETYEMKSRERKYMINANESAVMYQVKIKELEKKVAEALRLKEEYERKMKQKEKEQRMLKKEIAEIAVRTHLKDVLRDEEINEEKRKQRCGTIDWICENLDQEKLMKEEFDKLKGDIRSSELKKRKLQSESSHCMFWHKLNGKIVKRHLADTRIELQMSSKNQKKLNNFVLETQNELKLLQINNRLEEHSLNHRAYLEKLTNSHGDKENAETGRFPSRLFESKRRGEIMSGMLKHGRKFSSEIDALQKLVSKGEILESALQKDLRNTEYARQREEKSLMMMQSALMKTMKRHDLQVNKEAISRQKREMELQQKMYKQKSKLKKVQVEQELMNNKLLNLRSALKEDRLQFSKRSAEYKHQLQISQKTSGYLPASFCEDSCPDHDISLQSIFKPSGNISPQIVF